jgi:hypothetical protein
VAAAPDALALEARGGERQAPALLEAAVRLDLHVVRRGDADEAAVEGPPAEDVGHVLPAEPEAEEAVREVPPLDVAVHDVDGRDLEAGDEADPVAGGRVVVRLAASLGRGEVRVDAEVGVDAHVEDDAIIGLPRPVLALEVVDVEAERLREPPPIEHDVAPRRRDLVALERGVARDLEVGGARGGREEHHRRRHHPRGRRGATASGRSRHAHGSGWSPK